MTTITPNTIYKCRSQGWYRRVIRIEPDAKRRPIVFYEGRKLDRLGVLKVVESSCDRGSFLNFLPDPVDAWPEELADGVVIDA